MFHTSVAQLVEQWSPKPKVVGSSPTRRAICNAVFILNDKFLHVK